MLEAVSADPKPIYLSPSNFAFLYDECKCCYYNDLHKLAKRPRQPMPSIFSRIDNDMKSNLTRPEGEFVRLDGLEQGFWIEASDKRVTSAPFTVHGSPHAFALRGNFDSRVRFEDGAIGIIDMKTSAVKAHLIEQYARQLHTYKYAAENPLSGAPLTIDRLGLAVYEPGGFRYLEDSGHAYLGGRMTWLEVPVDMPKFEAFLQDVATLLSQPSPPPPDLHCSYCAYRMSYALTPAELGPDSLSQPNVASPASVSLRIA